MTWSFDRRLSLKTRLALAMVVIVAVLGLSIRLFVEQRLADDMEQELESHAVTVATSLAAESVEPILYQDRLALDRLLRTAKRTWGDFEYAFVLDPTRNVLVHTLMGDFPDQLRRLNRFKGGTEPQIHRTEALGYFHRDVAVPIYGGQLGVLHLGVRDKSIVDRLALLRQDVVVLLALVAGAGALLAFAVARRGLRPLGAIVEVLERFRPGRRRDVIAIESTDEVGEVARRVNDVTLHLHQAQLLLDHENRLACLGRLASVIAHEVGNPLASLMTRLDLMARSDEERFLRDSLPLLKGQLGRIQKLVHGLSHMSRSQRAETCTCDVNEVVREVFDLLCLDPRTAKTTVELELGELGAVPCIRDQLVQVLMNLGINALRAAGPSGHVSITTRPCDQGVCVEVQDSGPGVPASHRDSIFDPFFSTESGGTGLGLTISRDLVRQQGGDLRLVPCAVGACFQVRLPQAHTMEQGYSRSSTEGI